MYIQGDIVQLSPHSVYFGLEGQIPVGAKSRVDKVSKLEGFHWLSCTGGRITNGYEIKDLLPYK